MKNNFCKPRTSSRSGMIMVEFAVVLPLLFLVIFGSVQIANMLHTHQFLTEVTYQGALQGMSPFSNESNIRATMSNSLGSRNISGADISLTGLDGTTSFESLPSGSPFVASVSLDASSNYGGPIVKAIGNLEATSFGIKQ